MSNLSDLLPAGAAAKQLTFTDSGSGISSKAPVVLNSDGTVSSITSSAQSIGTEATFMTGSTYGVRIVYDDNANKVVVAYRDTGNSNHGYAAVGTISDTSISWGTPVVFESNSINGDLWASYDSAENKVVIAYCANIGSSQGRAIVGDVSGSSISFGTAVIFSTNSASQFGCAYDVANAKTVIAYKDGSTDGMAVVATVSSTSISYGTPVQYNNGNSLYNDVIYDSNAEKVVISFRDASASDNGKAVVGSVSGTSISYGAVATFYSGTTDYTSSAFDSTNNKAVIIYVDQSDSNKGKGVVGTISGTSISFGDAATWTTTNSPGTAATFDPDTGQVIVVGTANQGAGQFARGTVSGTSISFSELFTFTSGNTDYPTATYDTGSDRAVFAYQDAGNSLIGTGIVVQVGSTNLTAQAFVGVADSAISASAAGSVIVQGGTVTGMTLPTSNEANALSTFENAGEPNGIYAVYNPDADRVVISYCDSSNSNYLTLISGSVGSDGTITWGTNYVVTSNSYQSNRNGLCYDTTNNKLVVVGVVNSSPYNVALYTVTQSGDTFSYVGGANVSTGGNKPIPYFDPDTGQVLVTYRNGFTTSNYYPAGVVVDCSPTTPTYGSEVVIESVNSYPTIRATYDTTADKFICCYTQAASPYNAVYSVLEISGTSFTASTPTTFSSSGFYPLPLYIPSLDKTAIAYWYYPTDPGNLKAVVASLSGTTLTFGTAVDVTLDSIWTEEAAVTYDTSQSKFVIAGAWYDTTNTGADSNDGHVFFGTISGTDITFSGGFDFGGSETVAESSSLVGATYDSTENKVVIAYGTTTSTEGKAFSVNYVSAPPSGQNWYVQTDGTLSTTAGTPSVKAGINISGTSLLLNGDS